MKWLEAIREMLRQLLAPKAPKPTPPFNPHRPEKERPAPDEEMFL